MPEDLASTVKRGLTTWLPVVDAFFLVPVYGLSALAGIIGQVLLLALTAHQIIRREGEVGKTTAATWFFLLAVTILIPLSAMMWLFRDLGL
ncbi:hypothetical protein [Hymenobacter lucidus]|uniref:Cardiolipin synthase N-terminal domain-containing protein n=1 Tax=Hymenobacter lucidus TaxID=2880930 RepID=A0ABS8ARG4_9BACT|nr:hypothetical protein [Hymenobacter lucidus]MCB2408198.1 hypothetical protein [Hymenobacter lucidus]